MPAVGRAVLEAFALVLIGCAAGLAGNAVRARGLDLGRDYFSQPAGDRSEGGDERPPSYAWGEVTLQEVIGYFNDPEYVSGSSDTRFVFIDARDDANYADGHIPGALLFNHYFKDDYLPEILPIVENVDKVIVYCNGGTCEDSKFVCGDLLAEDVPAEKILLFTGGLEQWTKAEQPVEKVGQ